MKNIYQKKIILLIIFFSVFRLSVFAGGNSEQQRAALNQRKPVAVNQDLIIQIADINNYISFYPVETDGLRMEIMIVKAPDGTIRTAFNICHFCYQRNDDPKALGYFTQVAGPRLVSLCGSEQILTMDKIQLSSGACHPEPIPAENRTVTASTVTITRAYLQRAKAMFAEMKLLDEKGSCCD